MLIANINSLYIFKNKFNFNFFPLYISFSFFKIVLTFYRQTIIVLGGLQSILGQILKYLVGIILEMIYVLLDSWIVADI